MGIRKINRTSKKFKKINRKTRSKRQRGGGEKEDALIAAIDDETHRNSGTAIGCRG